MQVTIRVANNNNVLVAQPTSIPTIQTSAISDLTNYSNTEMMLANVATAYTNAVNYAISQNDLTNYSNTEMMLANVATAYTNAVATAASNAAALYQTTAGLSANVLVLTSNNATYFNGVSLSSVNSAITSNASAAYSNAVSYVSSQNYANTSQVSGNAATAYSNAVTFASNASNITTGTLPYSVLDANVVSNAQLQSNLSSYQTTAGLSANVAVLTANAAGFLGNSFGTIANVVSWITSNAATAYSNAVANAAAIYQTKAGLSANVLTLTSNNSTNFGGLSLTTVQSQITGNAATAYSNAVANAAALYQTTAGLSANVLVLTSNNTNFVGSVSAANVVSNAQLQSNLANYALLTGAVFSGQVNTTTFNTSGNTNIGGNLTITGSFTVGGNVNVIGANNLYITDNMIYLNSNATNVNPDIGIAANYNDGTYHHTGIFRDHTSGTWKVFDNYLPEPDASIYIDQSNSTFNLANFQANVIYVGNNSVYATVNTTNYSGTANNANNLGGVTLTTIQSQITGNAATAYSNAVANAAALYQTTAGLSANVLTLSSNNASYLGGVAAASYVNTSGAYTITGVHTHNANVTLSSTAAIIANGTSGTANQVLTSNGTGAYWSTPSVSSYTRSSFTATAGQTTFSVSYTVGSIQVYLNGVLMNSADYTAADGTSVVLATGCLVEDIVEFIAISSGNINVVSPPIVTIFTSSGTYTKRASSTVVQVLGIGGGGGGGFGGTYSPSTTGGSGGGAGGGAAAVTRKFRASDLSATESVVIGTGGLGGQSGVTPTGGSIAGQGGRGGITSFGTKLYAGGGGGGAPGSLGSASGGGGGAAALNSQGGFGTNSAGGSGSGLGNAGGFGAAGGGYVFMYDASQGGPGCSALGVAFAGGGVALNPSTGGAGGGFNASGVPQPGGASGGAPINGSFTLSAGGAINTPSGGGTGTSSSVLNFGASQPATGGGGGGAGSTANGGSGGTAGNYGSSGGGGGAGDSSLGRVGGVGGAGAQGVIVVVEW